MLCVDMLAVPVYPSAATEHWGIVTYRESRLLYDSDQVNDFDKQRTISIIAHELAHNVRHHLSASLYHPIVIIVIIVSYDRL